MVMDGLPDFVIAGTTKGGTTWLRHVCEMHPQLFMGNRPDDGKAEMHYFDLHYVHGEDWYRRTWTQPPGVLGGDKTPNIIYDPDAMDRMRELLPLAKIIISVREPVSRLWSHVRMRRRRQRETGTQLDLLKAAREWPQALLAGQYADNLQRLWKLYPRERTLVLVAERMRARPRQQANRVYAFLGVDPQAAGAIKPVRNADHNQERPTEATLAAMKKLRAFYAPYNAELRELLEDDLPEWR